MNEESISSIAELIQDYFAWASEHIVDNDRLTAYDNAFGHRYHSDLLGFSRWLDVLAAKGTISKLKDKEKI